MRDPELRAVLARVIFWLFSLSSLCAGLASAFLWFTDDAPQTIVAQTQPLPEASHTRGRLP